jgi:opacity protein-like surface antigen
MEMQMKRIAMLIAAATLATPALAGGPTTPIVEPEIVPAPVPVVAPSADWSGFYAGAQLGYADVDSNGAGLDGTGELGGIHAGYRWDLGTTVLGAEVDWDSANVDLGAGADDLDSVARLKLTAGADLGRTLLYATAGGARASATVGGAGLSDNGWFLGAGATYALTDQWTLGGEILSHRFDDFDGTGVDLDATTVTARVGFQF